MKKFTTLAVVGLLFAASQSSAQQNIGIGTTTPDASARLEINANNKGLLIPKVSLTSLTDVTTIATPANGLLVFNTNAALAGGTGFFYNSGTTTAASWVRLQTGAGGGGAGWSLTGNTGTDSLVNFVGTTDAKPLVLRVNNGFFGQLGSRGGISLGRGANGLNRKTPPSLIAIGDSALYNNNDSFNVAIGRYALYGNTVGRGNVGLGNNVIRYSTGAIGNVAVGDFNLAFSDSAFNTAIGYRALVFNGESDNTAVGAFSLFNNGGGYYNTAVGSSALTDNDNGAANSAIGYFALGSNISGDLNTASGYGALANDTSGASNTAVGSLALIGNLSGNNNVAVGYRASAANATGSFNVALGDSSGTSSGALFNTVALGFRSATTANNQVRIGNAATTSIGGAVSWTSLSDGRYKKDVQQDVKGLDFIMQLRPVTYHYNYDKMNEEAGIAGAVEPGIRKNMFSATRKSLSAEGSVNQVIGAKQVKLAANAPKSAAQLAYEAEILQNQQIRYTGFIAQEVEAAAKKIGFDFSGVDKPKNENDRYGLRYSDFVVPLVKAVQEQQAVIEAQNKKIEDLTRRLEALEKK